MMRRTLESVAAERLNKLGKNPNIISSRQDLKSDRETLKNIVAKASPIPSSTNSSEEDLPTIKLSKSCLNSPKNKEKHLKKNASITNIPLAKTEQLSTPSPTTPVKGKKKLIKNNLQMHIPHILKKSPSTPSKLLTDMSSVSTDPCLNV